MNLWWCEEPLESFQEEDIKKNDETNSDLIINDALVTLCEPNTSKLDEIFEKDKSCEKISNDDSFQINFVDYHDNSRELIGVHSELINV